MRSKIAVFPTALALAALLASSAAQAQPSRRDHGMHHILPGAEHQLARLDAALDLTDEQSAQLLPILQDAEAERRELHERMMEQLRPELCAMMDDTHAQILSVLTPEQAEQFEEIKEGHLERFERHRDHRGKPGLDCDSLDS